MNTSRFLLTLNYYIILNFYMHPLSYFRCSFSNTLTFTRFTSLITSERLDITSYHIKLFVSNFFTQLLSITHKSTIAIFTRRKTWINNKLLCVYSTISGDRKWNSSTRLYRKETNHQLQYNVCIKCTRNCRKSWIYRKNFSTK